MPRKFKSPERFLEPDPKHKSKLVSKFINCIMSEGKKTIAAGVFYRAMDIVQKKIADKDPVEIFNAAINNVKPLIEVRSKRVGGATYQVPKEVEKKRQLALAIRWIIESSREKKGRPFASRLADEIVAAYKHEGSAVTKRENVHKMAEANKAFAHFAW
jgi:small subunit ribosomal protein S7